MTCAKLVPARYLVKQDFSELRRLCEWGRITACLPVLRVHDLRHTFGRRLRAAGVSLETRKVLLGHKNGDITTHYSAPEIKELIDAVDRLAEGTARKLTNVTLLHIRAKSVTA